MHPSLRVSRDLHLKHTTGVDREQVRIEFLLADFNGVALDYRLQQCVTHFLCFYDVSVSAGPARERHYLVSTIPWCWCLRQLSVCSHLSTACKHQLGSRIPACELTCQGCGLNVNIRHRLQQQGIWRSCIGLQCPDCRCSQPFAHGQCCSHHKDNTLSVVALEPDAHLACTGTNLLQQYSISAPRLRCSAPL